MDLYKANPIELLLYSGLSDKLDKYYAQKYGITENKKVVEKKERKNLKRVYRDSEPDSDPRTAGRFKVRRQLNKKRRG